MTQQIHTFSFLAGAAILLGVAAASAQTIQVTLTTNVLVNDVMPLGINFSDNYWESPVMKKTVEENFEGVTYRQCFKGILYTNGFLSYFGSTNQLQIRGWNDLYVGAPFEVLSDPERHTTGTVTGISYKWVDVWNKGEYQWRQLFELDVPMNVDADGERDIGLLIERLDLVDEGYVGDNTDNWWVEENCMIETNDAPAGSFGNSSLRMDGSVSKSTYRLATFFEDHGEVNGDWNVHFWVKKFSGSPVVRLISVNPVSTVPVNVNVPDNWEKRELQVLVSGLAGNDHTVLTLEVDGGTVLIDDVEVWKDSDTNPTAFRDDFVDTIKSYNPGVLRSLAMGGWVLSNSIPPRLQQNRYLFQQDRDVGVYGRANQLMCGVHEFLELCEEVECEPWLTISGTLREDEMAPFVEYLSGSTNTPMGSWRSQLGHPEPWVDTFEFINVEFGNEAWNSANPYLFGGFNGADYWHDLIAAAKGAIDYQSNILFHVAGQNFSSGMAGKILADVTNADHYAIAPYSLSRLYTNDLVVQNTDQKLFQWIMAHSLWEADERMDGQADKMVLYGVEYSIYENNYHTTYDGSNAAPVETINRFMGSKAHGVSMANYGLRFLKDYGMRRQCFFNFCQESYAGVNLWGSLLNYKEGVERYRPIWLANLAINRVREGDLVETVHSTNPTLTTYGRYDTDLGDPFTNKTYDEFFSYAFRNQGVAGLVLVNYNLTQTQQVSLVLNESAANQRAQSWLLVSDSYTNNNEAALQVTLEETSMAGFTNGIVLEIPPCTLRVLKWEFDTDSDGLPDPWEQEYFGGPTNANPLALSSNGVDTVWQAYIAGLNPIDPYSVFQLSNLRNTLWWNTVSNRVYNIYWTTNLLEGFQPLETNYTGGVFTDIVNEVAGRSFYKIDIRLEP